MDGKVVFEQAEVGLPDFVLDIGSFVLSSGIVVLRGANGSGKSTLARACLGLVPPSRGTRRVAPGLSLAYMPQSYREALVPFLTGLDNLTLYDREQSMRSRLLEQIGTFGVGSTDLRKRPHRLSGGQCQKLVLTREALLGAAVLALDEPFSSLDCRSQDAAGSLIGDVARRGTCVLLITHGDLPPSIRPAVTAEYDIVRTEDNRACISKRS